MKNSTKAICIAIMFSIPGISYSQSYEWTNTDFRGSICQDILEIDGKHYAILANDPLYLYDSTIEYKLSVAEIIFSQNGSLDFVPVEFFTLNTNENFATVSIGYIEDTQEWLHILARRNTALNYSLRFALYDASFNIKTSQDVDVAGRFIEHFYIDSYNGHTYVLGTIFGPPADRVVFLNYDHSKKGVMPSIVVGQTSPKHSTLITSMCIDPRTAHMMVFYYSGIQELDTALYQQKMYHLTEINTGWWGEVLCAPEYYYSHGAYRRDVVHSGFKIMLIQKYDTLFNILASDTLGPDEHDNYPFFYHSIDRRNGELLVGGHLDGPFTHFDPIPEIKAFYLAKYDEDINRIWYKEYGGDRAYWFNGIKLLEDGSGLAYGFITDTLDGYQYAYILHVDANGDILSSTTLPPPSASPVRIVNDGGAVLRLQNPDLYDATICLFDLQGRQIFSKEFNTAIPEFDLDYLPQGLYPYSVFSKGKMISQGKWLKGN